jgi:6-phosphogluconolactonase
VSGRDARTAVYASTGTTLLHYDLDADRAALVQRSSDALPEDGQYAWPHRNGRYLYVACSNGSPGNVGDVHCACALRIAADGRVTLHGPVVPLPARPVHITTDIPGRHILTAYNDPSGLTVHRIRDDGTIGNEVEQRAALDVGIFAHQTRIAASGRFAILVTRGNDATATRPEDPGALKIYEYDDGQLMLSKSIAPGGGLGYGPRHVEFDVMGSRLFVSLERQNRLQVHRMDKDAIDSEPLHSVQTLAEPSRLRPAQRAGTLHVHPSGRVLYVANRADGTVMEDGQRVYAGGENNIAVYAIDDASAPPRVIQHADTRGIVPRTFAIDASAHLLIAANSKQLRTRIGGALRPVPAGFALFHIRDDGRLDYIGKHDVDVGTGTLFWMGSMRLQG